MPRTTKAEPKLTREDLIHYTRNVPDDIGPGPRIVQHFEAIKKYIPPKSYQQLGAAFEQCVYDALVEYGVQIQSVHTDMSPGSDAEADIVVEFDGITYPVLIKTSFRERWKQVDRDARIMADLNWGKIHPRVIFLREQDLDTPDIAIRRARIIQAKVRAPNIKIVSAMDSRGMHKLFYELGADIEEPITRPSGLRSPR